MAEQIVLEFEGVGRDEYDAVNGKLGVDPATGDGDWPAGLLLHTAGTTDRGTFVVTEVWTSREAQAEFMQSRLGEALAAGGVTAAPTVTWVTLLASHHLDG
jgi:hypothetical protein